MEKKGKDAGMEYTDNVMIMAFVIVKSAPINGGKMGHTCRHVIC
jgi:hypothetical protein